MSSRGRDGPGSEAARQLLELRGTQFRSSAEFLMLQKPIEAIKHVVRPMLGFKKFHCARITCPEIALRNMLGIRTDVKWRPHRKLGRRAVLRSWSKHSYQRRPDSSRLLYRDNSHGLFLTHFAVQTPNEWNSAHNLCGCRKY